MFKKPITRNEYIKNLSREHHYSLLFSWKIRQGLKKNLQPERIRGYVQYFWQENLGAHFREEEKILFAPIKDRQVLKAINEHKQIKQQIEDLGNYTGNDLRKKLAKLADTVYDHVGYAERELFPHLEKKLSEEQLEYIGRKAKKQFSTPWEDQYADQFWNIE